MSHLGTTQRIRTFASALVVLAIAGLLLVLLVFNLRLHQPGDRSRTLAQLQYLDNAIADGAPERMQHSFPEGYFFTWVLYGLTAAQLAEPLPPDQPEKRALLERCYQALRALESEAGIAPFDAHLQPQFGVFYHGWLAYLQGQTLRAEGPATRPAEGTTRFQAECARLATAFENAKTPFLDSYEGYAWPVDNALAIAALGIHDQLFPLKYRTVIDTWVAAVRMHLHPQIGGVPHGPMVRKGPSGRGVRGSTVALFSRVLTDAAPELALEQYQVLRRHFVNHDWGLAGVREYPIGESGPGDVDSGPILFGFSGPAVVVGAAAARCHGDHHLANALLGIVEATGFPLQSSAQRKYAAGLLPVGDAFIAWARSTPLGTNASGSPWTRALPIWWALPCHVVSLAIAFMMVRFCSCDWRKTKTLSRNANAE